MKEQLLLSHRVKRLPGNSIYVEYIIDNEEIKDTAFHGVEFEANSDWRQAIIDYAPIAREQLLIAVEGIFPEAYE